MAWLSAKEKFSIVPLPPSFLPFQFSHETEHFNHKGGWETRTVTNQSDCPCQLSPPWIGSALCANTHRHGPDHRSDECKRISPPMCQLFTQHAKTHLFHFKYLLNQRKFIVDMARKPSTSRVALPLSVTCDPTASIFVFNLYLGF